MHPHTGGGGGETQYVGSEATKAGMINGKGNLLQKGLWAGMRNRKENGEMEQKQDISVLGAAGFSKAAFMVSSEIQQNQGILNLFLLFY